MKPVRRPYTICLFIALNSLLISQAAIACDKPANITELGNSTYMGIEDQAVTLSDGIWEGPAYVEGGASRPRVGLLENLHLRGDLDGDEQEEAIVFLWQSAAGTGNNLHIAVMQAENAKYENTSTALVGDRVKIRRAGIASGKIFLDVLQAGENDAMCCPTQIARRSWGLKDMQLEENEMEITGSLSLDSHDASEWYLTHFDHEKPVASDVEVTLLFNENRISGKSACNRYAAQISEGDEPGSIQIGQSMGTRMACPDHLMNIENKYLAALTQVTSFSFDAGRLTLSGQTGDETQFVMYFNPAKASDK